ncbi:PEP-CTERM sorting domain-containing protein [Amantichitinum ursilacus]|uniref:PEP-CTERM motif protein n=1 Tax=Amantichitinum ursilacus TaxID=857265 RepID=A0A0N0XIT7_9NEIS|nr:PEP-CTERM sorting domain-containing protein [Amantichitinum ursilacus]KPC53178.1 PEP-CTERM motif protein [Amantichitinum ursilacus]
MKPRLQLATLLAALSLSMAAHAQLITFDDLTKPDGLPAVYEGFEVSWSTLLSTWDNPAPATALGSKTLSPGQEQSIELRSFTPFYLDSVHLSTAFFQQFDPVTSVVLRGYSAGQQVAYAQFNLDLSNPGTPQFEWYSLDGTPFDHPVDRLTFSGVSDGSLDTDFYLDGLNVRPVPEPETWALMGLGAVGVLARRQRPGKKRATA